MQVTLLNATDINVANTAASCCTGKVDNPSPTSLNNALKSGHLSVSEHIYLTFEIKGISRACLAQLTRHRHASFSVESQRYVDINIDTDWYVVPPSIEQADKSIQEAYHRIMRKTALYYQELMCEGVPREDARFMIPNACKTNLIMSMNLRAFIEQCHKRLCNKAQWEIRKLYQTMRNELLHKVFNERIARFCNPLCKAQGWCPESKPCGKEVE